MKGTVSVFVAAPAAWLVGQAAALPPRHPSTGAFENRAEPSVSISSGTILGSSALGIESFNGIPFAQPPVGPLRLKPPQSLNSSLGTFDATGIAPSCPQMYFSTGGDDFLTQVLGDIADTPPFQEGSNQSEDCLTLNVQRPAGTTADAELPVLFWMYGGSFEVSRPPLCFSNRGSELPCL